MNRFNVRVILLDGHSRQVLPMARAFKKLGCDVTTLSVSKLDIGYISKYPDEKLIYSSNENSVNERSKELREILGTRKYQVVVPTTDMSATLLSKNKVLFSKYAYIAVPEWSTFECAIDKQKTMKICMENNIPCTISLNEIKSVQDILNSALEFPIVIKPRSSYGAIGFKIINSVYELEDYFCNSGFSYKDVIVQEYIPQDELQYETAMYIDDLNQVKSALVFSKNRWFPVNGGSSTLNITVKDDEKSLCSPCSSSAFTFI